jgi:hypothetical protein
VLDPCALGGDRAGELDERCETTPARRRDPLVEELDRVAGGQPVDLSELLLEQVGTVQPRVGLLNARELRLLAVGEVLGVLPQREPGALQIMRGRDLTGLARLVSDLATDLVQGVGRELDDVERVDAANRLRQPGCDWPGDPSGHVAGHQCDLLQRVSPSASQNASTVLRSRPAAAHTSRPV